MCTSSSCGGGVSAYQHLLEEVLVQFRRGIKKTENNSQSTFLSQITVGRLFLKLLSSSSTHIVAPHARTRRRQPGPQRSAGSASTCFGRGRCAVTDEVHMRVHHLHRSGCRSGCAVRRPSRQRSSGSAAAHTQLERNLPTSPIGGRWTGGLKGFFLGRPDASGSLLFLTLCFLNHAPKLYPGGEKGKVWLSSYVP